MIRIFATILLVSTAVHVSACSKKQENPPEETQTINIDEYMYIDGIYGAKAGVYITRLLSQPLGYTNKNKPSAALGVYVSSYIAQGAFTSVSSALTGITSQMKLIAGQQQVTTEEVFSLMTDYGALLQVNVPDMLNRSTDRERALDTYTENLDNFTLLMEQKEEEMKTREETLETKRREQKRSVQAVERVIKQAFSNDEFETAANKQEELAQLKAQLTKSEIQLEQIDDMRDRFKKVLKVGRERSVAIEANRRAILAGITIKKVPGIEEFDLIQK